MIYHDYICNKIHVNILEVHLLISRKLLGERPAVGDYIAGRFWLTASA